MNTTNTNLDLRQGAVSMALLQAGGQSLQQECTQKAPIKVGEVAVTGSGNLPCQLCVSYSVTIIPEPFKFS